MACNFHVGMDVVCVKAVYPIHEGTVLKIEQIDASHVPDRFKGCVGLRFVQIQDGYVSRRTGRRSRFWYASRNFRPCEKPKVETNISIFTEMLKKKEMEVV